MNYLSICSGIEAASVAWEKSLGWKPRAFAEIEPFPCAVLAHHWPEVPNLGDMTRYPEWPDARTLRPDLVVAGTPCQAFSVAGLRRGLADPRGNLTLVLLGILERYRPRWVVWENVPGVLSSVSDARPPATPPDPPLDLECDGQTVETHDDLGGDEVHAFHCFLAGLSELGYGFAYRVLDAQFTGVPQRRRRVFVVGYLGDWRRAAAVLFESESLRGDSPPRREAGEGTAGTLTGRAGNGSRPAGANGNLIPTAGPTAAVTAKWAKGSGGPSGDECQNLVAHALRGEGFDASEDGTGRGIPLVVASLDASYGKLHGSSGQDLNHGHSHLIAFDCKASGQNGFGVGEVSPTLRSMGHTGSHQNAGGQVAICFDSTQITSAENRSNPQAGDPCPPLSAGAHPPAVAFNLRGREEGAMPEVDPDNLACQRAASGGSSRSYVATGWAVRRLTPMECERLQGFPDGHTLIPWRGKPADLCPDGPRYKALGNSMAVPVMRWIGERIAACEALQLSTPSASAAA